MEVNRAKKNSLYNTLPMSFFKIPQKLDQIAQIWGERSPDTPQTPHIIIPRKRYKYIFIRSFILPYLCS